MFEISLDEIYQINQQKYSSKYEELSKIDNGSFSTVKKLQDRKTNKIYAVKILDKSNSKMNTISLLKSEITVLKQADHPNIVHLYDYYETNHSIYIVMEYIKNGTLKDYLIKHNNVISENNIKKIMYYILSAVDYLHKLNIIHKDLKLENIMFDDENDFSSLKIIDFGLSTQFQNFETQKKRDLSGTVLFMAPEKYFNNNYSKSIDIWSVGIIMYMLLNLGTHPFYEGEDSVEEYFLKVKKSSLVYKKNLSKNSKDLLSHLLCFDPLLRYTPTNALDHAWFKDIDILLRNNNKYNKDDIIKCGKELAMCFLFLSKCKKYFLYINSVNNNYNNKINNKQKKKNKFSNNISMKDYFGNKKLFSINNNIEGIVIDNDNDNCDNNECDDNKTHCKEISDLNVFIQTHRRDYKSSNNLYIKNMKDNNQFVKLEDNAIKNYTLKRKINSNNNVNHDIYNKNSNNSNNNNNYEINSNANKYKEKVNELCLLKTQKKSKNIYLQGFFCNNSVNNCYSTNNSSTNNNIQTVNIDNNYFIRKTDTQYLNDGKKNIKQNLLCNNKIIKSNLCKTDQNKLLSPQHKNKSVKFLQVPNSSENQPQIPKSNCGKSSFYYQGLISDNNNNNKNLLKVNTETLNMTQKKYSNKSTNKLSINTGIIKTDDNNNNTCKNLSNNSNVKLKKRKFSTDKKLNFDRFFETNINNFNSEEGIKTTTNKNSHNKLISDFCINNNNVNQNQITFKKKLPLNGIDKNCLKDKDINLKDITDSLANWKLYTPKVSNKKYSNFSCIAKQLINNIENNIIENNNNNNSKSNRCENTNSKSNLKKSCNYPRKFSNYVNQNNILDILNEIGYKTSNFNELRISTAKKRQKSSLPYIQNDNNKK